MAAEIQMLPSLCCCTLYLTLSSVSTAGGGVTILGHELWAVLLCRALFKDCSL